MAFVEGEARAADGEPVTGGRAAFCARHYMPLLLAVLVLALALRLWLALNAAYLYDEQNDWILTAVGISFDPDTLNLPLRTDRHGAFVAWLIRLGSLIGDGSHLAYRWTSILAGIGTIAVTATLARRHAGPLAGLAAAALMGLNEYHITMSALAIQISWYMLFSALTILFFLDYLDRRAGWRLVLAAVFAGLSILAYELAVLTVLFLALYALIRLGPRLLARRELYLAAAAGLLIILPDVLANLLQPATDKVTYAGLLGRIAGLGVNPQYLAFWGRDVLEFLYPLILDRPFMDNASEYKAMNPLMGLVLGGSVLIWLLALPGWIRLRLPRHALFYLLLFCGVFGFFTIIETRNFGSLWLWVGVTLIPGAVLAGGLIAQAGPALRMGVAGLAGLGALWTLASLGWSNYDLPRMQGHPDPVLLKGPPGSMAEVEVHFDFCDLCDPAPELRLADIAYVRDDVMLAAAETPPVPVLGTDEVADAEPGTDDRRFRLLVEGPKGRTGWMLRGYIIRYDVISQGRPAGTAEARAFVPFNQALVFPPIFWMNRP